MKKYTAVIGVIIICLSAMSGCIKKSLPELPDDAAAFEMGTFVDKEHDDASFGTIEYDGRTYIMYGTTNNRYRQSCVESCIGYVVQNEQSASVTDLNDTNRRVYVLSGDPEHNFLMEFDASIKLMDQPSFFRAVDTNGKKTDIPEYIDPLGYEFWREE